MSVLDLLALISAGIVSVALLHGAYWDIKTRTAPKEIWWRVLPFALFFTFLWYCLTFAQNGLNGVLGTFLISMILCPVAMWMGYRMGSGGDWRALYFVALITPFFAPLTWLLAVVLGVLQVLLDKIRKAPQESAWMVSIALAFVCAILISSFV